MVNTQINIPKREKSVKLENLTWIEAEKVIKNIK